MLNSDPRLFKVAFLGPCGSGKTCIITRFHEGGFSPRTAPTIGASFVTHTMHTAHGSIELNIWDTAGQETYRSIVPLYCRNSQALVIVYDISLNESFIESKIWCEKYRSTEDQQRVYYVANKVDLSFDPGVDKAAREFAESVGAAYFQTSAQTGEGIQALFQTIADQLAGSRFGVSATELVPAEDGKCCRS
jgi:small GTP-binding protein